MSALPPRGQEATGHRFTDAEQAALASPEALARSKRVPLGATGVRWVSGLEKPGQRRNGKPAAGARP